MDFIIVIPAHNEENSIALMIESIAKQTLLPKKVIVVDDNSTDGTKTIVEQFINRFSWLSLISISSTDHHLPGAKVIETFYAGFDPLTDDFDIICKFDADIILPTNYLESINYIFENDRKVGIAGGLVYIEKNSKWIYEPISDKSHVRGPIKSYRKECFNEIGGLRRSIGWDTVDTLLAKYYGWRVVTDKSLHVKHLKPTGSNYNESSKYLQGEAMFKMRYGFVITLISALKLSYKKKNIKLLKNYVIGYFKAKNKGATPIVTKEQGHFIRTLRWDGIFKTLGLH